MNETRNASTALTAFPVPAPRLSSSAGVELTHELMRFLTSGAFKPHHRLPGERALAEHMGVGRTVIREAIPFSGVARLTRGPARRRYLSPRRKFGTAAASDRMGPASRRSHDRLPCRSTPIHRSRPGRARRPQHTEADLGRIQQWFWFMEGAAESGDVPKFVDADTEFHLAIATAARNSVLAGVLTNIRSLMRVWTERVVTAHVRLADSLEVHRPIREAIESGDEQASRAAMAEHMDQAIINLRRALDAEPNTDEPQRT